MGMSIDEHLLYEMGYNKGFKDGVKGSIPKADYEARLKAEKVYLLKDVRKEVLNKISQLNMMQYNLGLQDALEIVDQYISAEQENEDATN